MNVEDRLIIALDVSDAVRADELITILRPVCPRFKVGLELFTSAGPDFVRRLADSGLKIFLDLKLHDIPNTVASAVKSIGKLGVEMFTIHASGGSEMMKAAVEAAASAPQPPIVLGVTVLTSMSAEGLGSIGVQRSPEEQVLSLAWQAKQSGCHGIVASAQEVKALRQRIGYDMYIVTPGIRPAGSEVGDQKRTGTPSQAIADGASFLVIGRPILTASDPVYAARNILGQIPAA